jgi:peptidoglycan/LPS O-acetylase OafA/YrhL
MRLLTQYTTVGLFCCWFIGLILSDQTSLLFFLSPSLQHQIHFFLQLGTYFFSGVCLYIWRSKIPLNGIIAIFCLCILVLTIKNNIGPYCLQLILPYLVIYAAHIPVQILRNFGKYGDFSYGIYLYAFPIQQTVVSHLPIPVDLTLYMSISYALTLFVAVLSWQFIESPALRVKDRLYKIES